MRYDSCGRKLAAHVVLTLCESLKRFGDLNGHLNIARLLGTWQLRNASKYATGVHQRDSCGTYFPSEHPPKPVLSHFRLLLSLGNTPKTHQNGLQGVFMHQGIAR